MTGRAWLVVVVAVVIGAVLQAATSVPGAGTVSGTTLVLDVTVSFLALVLELALLAWAVRSIALHEPLGRFPRRLLVWSALLVVVAAAVAVVLGPVVVLVLVAGLCVLPAAAAGERNALGGLRVFRRTPGRAVGAAIVAVVVAAVTWVLALAAGLFLAGALGAAAMWLWFGIVLALLLGQWTRLAARVPTPSATAPDEPATGTTAAPRS